MTRIFFVQVESPLSQSQRESLLECLPAQRAARMRREKKENRNDEVLYAYGLLTLALADCFAWKRIPPITLSVRGKPSFTDYADLHFSISHSQGAALAGISQMPLGVDLERLRPAPKHLSKRFALADDAAFWDSWTRREALAKLRDQPPAVMDRNEAALFSEESLVQLTGLHGYAAAAAGKEPLPSGVEIVSAERFMRFASGQ